MKQIYDLKRYFKRWQSTYIGFGTPSITLVVLHYLTLPSTKSRVGQVKPIYGLLYHDTVILNIC